ncbi:hypothetical protein OROMI_014425 [Orobanche minor]
MKLRPAASASITAAVFHCSSSLAPADGIDSYHLCHRLPRSSTAVVSYAPAPPLSPTVGYLVHA